MAFLDGPPEIERILATPGAIWPDADRRQIETWLNLPPQLARLLRYVLMHLGAGATAHDAEDMWQQYCADQLDALITRFDPARGRFQSYLLMCLRQACWKQGADLRQTRDRETPLTRVTSDGESFELEIEVTDDDPEAAARRGERRERVRRCVQQLPPQYREVVVRHHFQECGIAEIAARLGMGESLVKQRLFRGRHWLKQCLAGIL